MVQVCLLGSTGSIGVNTLDVLRRHRERYQVHSLVAGRNLARLAEQAAEFRPPLLVIDDAAQVPELLALLPYRPEILAGAAGRVTAAAHPDVDFVLSAIVGVAGLEATYEAALRGTRIGLANKETLVAGGALVMDAAQRSGSEIIPVDSEHNGAHQCLRAGRRHEVTRLILTASGGPFRTWTSTQMEGITPAQALKHPTWKMGQRITIDSATLMNKGFEVMEACWLFGFAPEEVDVVVHPQSQVHAMVEFNDGSVILQACATDMRMPIQYALTYPARDAAPVPTLAWNELRQWEFHPPDWDRFPLLGLAFSCQKAGGSAGTILNAADEIAVEAFLEERIPFSGITEVVRRTLDRLPVQSMGSVAELLEVDRKSREIARACVTTLRATV